MKKNNKMIIVILTGLLSIFGCDADTNQKKQITKISFEQQFETFKLLGYTLNKGTDTADLNRWENGHKEFEESPYSLMYQTLGQTIEREPWTPLTNKCWDFDLEAIANHGDYVGVMENISRITNGDLIFDSIKDYVDIEEGKAWVSFSCNGDNYKWDLKVDDDWADGSLFDKVQALTQKYKTKGKLTYFNTGGQSFVLGYHTPDELQKINEMTGLNIEWLNAKGQIY